ncbi:hypothetical protein BCR34DRAFT_459763, partial [Clohesyomyces aquaticus]
GTLHRYTSRLVAFEHASPSPATNSPGSPLPKSYLLWIGGLGDGLLTVYYPSTLAQTLPSHWAVVEVLISSSYRGWGTGDLRRDVKELGRCVTYFREIQKKQAQGKEDSRGKIVLMGHSTGCQDIMQYLTFPSSSSTRLSLDGAILQAGISDREGLAEVISTEEYSSAANTCREWIAAGRANHVLPPSPISSLFGAQMTASRCYSLLSPPPEHDGEDDFFSSDLSDTRLSSTFGKIGKESNTKMMFILSGDDEHMPPSVDKHTLISRWNNAVVRGGGTVDEANGGIIQGATHNLNGNSETVVKDLCTRVARFLGGLE